MVFWKHPVAKPWVTRNMNRNWMWLHKCFQFFYSPPSSLSWSSSRWQINKFCLNKLVLNKSADWLSLESYNNKPIRLQRRRFNSLKYLINWFLQCNTTRVCFKHPPQIKFTQQQNKNHAGEEPSSLRRKSAREKIKATPQYSQTPQLKTEETTATSSFILPAEALQSRPQS